MPNIKILFIFQLLFYIKVNSSLFDDLDQVLIEEERPKCMEPFDPSSEKPDKCFAITPSLELTGKNKGKCCKVSLSYDPFIYYENIYRENWKQKIINEFELDEDITEEEIRSKYLPSKKETGCMIFIDHVKDLMLYEMSLMDVNGQIEYDCGNGEEIFKGKDYHPTNEDEIFDKDFIDCSREYTEKNCNKRGMKFSFDDAQCCWCKHIYFSQNKPIDDQESIQYCKPFKISNMKEVFQNELKRNKEMNERLEFKCDCYNKNGKNVKASYNTVTGDIIIQ